jgi:phage-related protein
MQIPESYILVLAIFTAITAVAVLIQAGVLLGMFIVMRKATVKMLGVVDEVKTKALPAIASSKELLEDIAPKLKVATANLTEVSHTLKHETTHVSETVDELLAKVNAQMNRVDGMMTSTFDAVDRVTGSVEGAISTSGKRFSGVINGVRTGVGVFLGARRRSSYRDADGSARPERVPDGISTEPLKTEGFVAGQKQA